MPNTLHVIARPHALQAAHFVGGVPLGLTLAEIVDEVYDRGHVPAASRRGALVMINGEIVPPEMWARIRPKEAAHVLVTISLRGGGGSGKNPLATVLSLAAIVVAAYVAPALAFDLAQTVGAGWTVGDMFIASNTFLGIATPLIAGTIAIGGAMLANTLFPVRLTALSPFTGITSSPTYSIAGASNSANKFSPVPVVLGRHKHTPPLGAQSYTEIVGSDEYLRMLVVWGYGPLKIEDIKLGDTSIDEYDDVEIETREGREGDDPITLFPNQVIQDTTGVTLTQERGWVTRNVATGADEISLDFYFSSGLARIDSGGNIQPYSVEIEIQYRPVNSDTWLGLGTAVDIVETTLTVPQLNWYYIFVDLSSGAVFLSQSAVAGVLKIGRVFRFSKTTIEAYPVNGLTGATISESSAATITISAGTYESASLSLVATDAQVGTVRRTKRWTASRGDYQVRCRRLTADTDDTQILDDCVWSAVRVFRNENPVNFPYPLAMTALRVKATDQLQSTIRDLNATVTTYAPCYDEDTGTWIEAATQNPAALARLVLTGPANERRRTAEQIDDESFIDFYQFCEEHDYPFNMIRDYQASVWDTVSDICAAARAAPTQVDGKWGVIIDRAGKPVTQHFTPRNSWGFSGEKTLADLPHAWRIPFKDETNGFETDEAFVYADGYDGATATKYESLDLSGLTRFSDAWRQGRYRHAQVRLRPEIYRFNADFEHLVCRRGDRIKVGHDVPMWGTAWGRVKSLVLDEDGALAGVVLDEQVTMAEGTAYGCRFRREDGGGVAFSVVTEEGQTDTLLFQTAVPVAQGPAEGDLAMFGEAERETADLLVSAIRPSSDLTAEIECVDYSPEIYEADQGEIPAWDPHVSSAADVTTLRPAPPTITAVQSGTAALIVQNGTLRPRILVSMTVSDGSPRVDRIRLRWRRQGASAWSTVEGAPADSPLIADPVSEGVSYEYQAQAVSIYGVASQWTGVALETVLGRNEPPADVTGFRIAVNGDISTLTWDANTEIDLKGYVLRHSPKTSGATWGSSVAVNSSISGTSISVPTMQGTFLIKALDYAGRLSENPTLVVNTVSGIAAMNVVETITPEPTFSGVFSGTEVVSDTLRLELGEDYYPDSGTWSCVTTVDLGAVYSSRVSSAVTVKGINSAADFFSSEDIFSLSDWFMTDVADFGCRTEIATTDDAPSAGTWSGWREISVTDQTFRAIRFRLVLDSYAEGVTPVVSAAIFEVDMPDRVLGGEDVVCPAGGVAVTFSPPYKALKGLAFNDQELQPGDRAITTAKSATGFTRQYVDSSGTPVARSFDWVSTGYGIRQ